MSERSPSGVLSDWGGECKVLSGGTTSLVSSTATNDNGTISFACGACLEYNTVNLATETFYIVTARMSVDVFHDSVSFLILYIPTTNGS